MSSGEEVLTGGNATPVARVGERVHRAAGPWTDSVHALLLHVRGHGVTWVPEPHGRDDEGREVLGFVAGEVPAYPMPEWVWAAQVLQDAARHLREYHDATVDFPRAGRRWRLPSHEPDEVVCHNDFAPYNLVFRDGRLAGAIDFDMASPGPRAWDLAYLAHRLVPLSADAVAAAAAPRAARLRLLCAAYGANVAAHAVLDLVPARLEQLAAFTAERAAGADESALHEHVAIYRADAAYVRAHRDELLATEGPSR